MPSAPGSNRRRLANALMILGLLAAGVALRGAAEVWLTGRVREELSTRLGSRGFEIDLRRARLTLAPGLALGEVRASGPDGLRLVAREVRVDLATDALVRREVLPERVSVEGLRVWWDQPDPLPEPPPAIPDVPLPATAPDADGDAERPQLAQLLRRVDGLHRDVAARALDPLTMALARLGGGMLLALEDAWVRPPAGEPLLLGFGGDMELRENGGPIVAVQGEMRLALGDPAQEVSGLRDPAPVLIAAVEGTWRPSETRLEGRVEMREAATGPWLPGLPEAVAGRMVEWPRLSADLAGVVEAGQVEVSGKVALTELGVSEPRLTAVPLAPLEVAATFDVLATGDESWRIEARQWDGQVNGVPYTVGGTVGLTRSPWFDVSLEMAGVPFQDVLEAIPDAVVPEVADFRLGGTLDLGVRLRGRTQHLEGMAIDVGGDWSSLTLLSGRIPVGDGRYPLEGMEYQPLDPDMAGRGFTLSRTRPGWVLLDGMAQACIDAVVMAEDASFWHHEGFDVPALRDALGDNLEEGRTVRGGSTITQQLAKNLYLSSERNLARKLQEALLAWELEQRLTKRQILETYLNIIEWGPGIYGIGRAARHYFGRDPSALTVKQCVYLATIIPGPRKYYVYYLRGALSENWEVQVQQLLDKLWEFDRIGLLQYQQAMAEPVVFAKEEVRAAGSPGEEAVPHRGRRGGQRGGLGTRRR